MSESLDLFEEDKWDEISIYYENYTKFKEGGDCSLILHSD